MVKVLVTIPKQLLEKISLPEDIKKLQEFADVIFNEKNRNLTEDELKELISDVDGCITSWGSPKFTHEVLEKAKKLKIIGHAAGSVKPYVTKEVFKRGIVVVHAAPIIALAVAEFTLAMILNCLRRIPEYINAMSKKYWDIKNTAKFSTYSLYNKTIGIIGFGYVARILVDLLKPFNVKILVYDPYVPKEYIVAKGCIPTDLYTLLREADIVSIHAALTKETYHMIGEKELKMMKPHAFLINTARGAIIDEKALIKALKEGWISGATLDVFEKEPLPEDSELYSLSNIYLTPHVAGLSHEIYHKLFGTIVEEFERFFKGEKLRYMIDPKRFDSMA